ncbi:hypothetical protein CCP4SC76_4170002 [Gammaproteobacteria bacterium]
MEKSQMTVWHTGLTGMILGLGLMVFPPIQADPATGFFDSWFGTDTSSMTEAEFTSLSCIAGAASVGVMVTLIGGTAIVVSGSGSATGTAILRPQKPRPGRFHHDRPYADQFYSPDHRCRSGQWQTYPHRHALSAGAQWLPAYWPCQVDRPQLWHCRGLPGHLQPALRRYQSPQGKRRICRVHPGGCSLAGLRLGRSPVFCVGLF